MLLIASEPTWRTMASLVSANSRSPCERGTPAYTRTVTCTDACTYGDFGSASVSMKTLLPGAVAVAPFVPLLFALPPLELTFTVRGVLLSEPQLRDGMVNWPLCLGASDSSS